MIERLSEKALATVSRKTDRLETEAHQPLVDMPAARRAPGIEITRKYHGAVVLFDHALGNRQLSPEGRKTRRKIYDVNIDHQQRFRRPEQRVLGDERRFRGSKQRFAAFQVALPQRHGFTKGHDAGRALPRHVARRKRKAVHRVDGIPCRMMQRGFLERGYVRSVGIAIELRCPTRVSALPDVPVDQFDGAGVDRPGVDGVAGFARLLSKRRHALLDTAGDIHRGHNQRRLRGQGRPCRAR